MDRRAELTLRIVWLAQEARRSRRSMRDWLFLPQFRRAAWGEAIAILEEAPKPLLVAPLVEPGHVAVWPLGLLDEPHRATAAANMAGLDAYFSEKLRLCGLDDTSTIVLHTDDADVELPMHEFRRWYRDYTVAVGVTVSRGDRAGVGRLLVRAPGGRAPPLGEA